MAESWWTRQSIGRRALLVAFGIAVAVAATLAIRRWQRGEAALDAWCGRFAVVLEFEGESVGDEEYASLIAPEAIGVPPDGSALYDEYARLLEGIELGDEQRRSSAHGAVADLCLDRLLGSFY